LTPGKGGVKVGAQIFRRRDMRRFAEILAIAAERKGGEAAVFAGIPVPKSAEALAEIPDDRWLSAMAQWIFRAGISWAVVEAKWSGIEEAFQGFQIGPLSMMEDDGLERLLSDKRVIRSGPKIMAIRDNAAFLRQVGGFGRKVGDWPAEDFAGLVLWMQKSGSRLGGMTAPYMLRHMGKDSYVPSRDVVARLVAEGVVDKAPASPKAWGAVQTAFNVWQAESGLPLTTISRVLAQSVG
jgi:3-methyladenine DNA glycosylase Tag